MTRPLAPLLARVVGAGAPVRFSMFDGSAYGPADADAHVDIKSPKALRYLATAPGELGFARAYVAGEVDVDGDLYVVLQHLSRADTGSLAWGERIAVLRALGLRALRPVAPPPEEERSGMRRMAWGARHSRSRDAAAIAHHYDVSNRFYEWVLGPSMAYTCAVFPDAAATLEQAQHTKFDLVARKLALQPGMRLLDVGCGWGGMVMHAAQHYGVRSLGVTLSRKQAEWAQKAIAESGLSDLAEVRHLDYRDVTEDGFDAVSSIGLTEHVGERQLPAYFRFLHSKLRPQARLLNHSIMRPTTHERVKLGPFVDRYVFPDGELMALGPIVTAMQDNGFEIVHEETLREHYAKTLTGWCANLAAHWDDAVTEVGVGRARVWMLYMSGSRLAFEENRLQLHQILGVKTDATGSSATSLRPDWEPTPRRTARRRA